MILLILVYCFVNENKRKHLNSSCGSISGTFHFKYSLYDPCTELMKRVEFRLSQVEYVTSNRIPKIPWKIEKKTKNKKV